MTRTKNNATVKDFVWALVLIAGVIIVVVVTGTVRGAY